MIGKTISHYRILEQVGAGGMGVVYRAHDERLQRDVALKVLPADALADEEARKRFRKEALALSKLNHPNIATVFDFDHAEGHDFLAMELIAGDSLATRLERGPLSEKETAGVGAQIAAALEEAHERGMIHRDLKPGNVMVTPKGHVKVLDFGLAKLLRAPGEADATRSITETHAVSGTLPYMAPEQLSGEPLDARADIHALGAVLYETATGQRAFREQSVPRLTDAILHQLPIPPRAANPRLSSELERIILKCLEKDPGNRYQSAKEVAVDLRRLASPTSAATLATAVPTGWTWRRIALTAGMVAVAAVAVLVVLNVGGWRDRLLGRTAGPQIQSLAVLPLENLSGDVSQDYFADGMTEALISNLAQIGALNVISRTTVMQYKGTRKPLPQIAKELNNVDAVIVGSVQRAGSRVKITVQLNRAATDTLLWAKDYERDLSDVLALQGEVARAIANEIKIELTPREQTRLATVRSVHPEAYDLYLRGRAHSRHENREDNDAAIELLEKAVATDPQFADAHAELARAYNIRLFFFTPDDEQLDAKSLEEVETALRLDPDSSDAHLARGVLLLGPRRHFPHEQAIREFRRALELNPSSDEGHHQLGLVYLHIGLLEEAMREAQAAVKLNPGNTLALYRTGVVSLYLGDYQKAWEVFSKVPVDFNPVLVSYQNAWTLFYLGRKAEALTVLQEYLKKDPQDTGGLMTSMQALLAADAGDPRRAQEKIKTALEHGKGYVHFHHTEYNVASAYALMNRPAQALQWLQAAANDGLPCYPLFEKDPNLDKIRHDPGFVAFLTKQKQQWEAFKKM